MNAPAQDRAWPEELLFRRAARLLEIRFSDGFSGTIAFRRLREESPSAEVRGHGATRPAQPPTPEDVTVLEAQPVGRYAVRLIFSDGHRTGLYSWVLLRDLAEAG